MNARHKKLLEARERHWGKPVPANLKHGPASWVYRVYGCDCRVCLPSGRRRTEDGGKSHAQRQRELRDRKRGKPVPPGVKHGIYAYKIYECRCATCTATYRWRSSKKRNAWRGRAQGSWVPGDNGKTVVHWPPRGYGMWACPECGEKFQMRRPVDGHAEAA